MDYKKQADDILAHIGGRQNVVRVTHCASRLRFVLLDEKLANDEKIKNVEGVIGLVKKGGQYQLVIGQGIDALYHYFRDMEYYESNERGKTGKEKFNIIGIIAGCFTPLLPALTGAGMLRAILTLLAALGMNTQDPTYVLFQNIADATYNFMPYMLAFSAAIKFNTNPYMAVMLAGIPIQLNYMGVEKLSFFGLPITSLKYSSSVIPVILGVALLSFVEPMAEKISPKQIRFFLKPLLTILIVVPISLLVLGPIGNVISSNAAIGINFIGDRANWFITALFGAFSPLLVMTGMHYAYMPIAGQQYAVLGYEAMLFPGMLCANIAQGAAGFAVAAKTKNKKMRQVACSSAFTAVFGITEPVMYGVNLKLKKPFYAVMIGGGVSGLFAGIMGLKAYLIISPGLAGITMFLGGEGLRNFMIAIASIILSFVVTFTITCLIGFDDIVEKKPEIEAEVEAKVQETSPLVKAGGYVAAPFGGRAITLSQVNDPTFAAEIIGKGLAIVPDEGKLIAPFDCEVLSIFNTMHAIGLVSKEGVKILIHIGLDTVKLQGKYFKALVKAGDQIQKGEVLIEFDIDKIKAEGYDITSPIIVTNMEDYFDVISTTENRVSVYDTVIRVMK